MSAEAVEVVRLTKPRWIFVIVASVLAAVYGALVNFYIAWGGFQFALPWEYSFVGQAFGLMALTALINRYMLSRFSKLQLRAQDILILYGAMMVSLPVGGVWFHRMNIAPLMGMQFRPPWNTEVVQYLSKHFGLWVPSTDKLSAALYGGVSVPWGDVIVPIAFWFVWVMAVYVYITGLALISRKRWIDVEKLTFPLGVVPATAVMSSLGKDEESKSKWKIMALVVLVYWLMSRPIYLINAFRPGTIILPPGPVPASGIWEFLVLNWGSFDIPWNLNRYEGWWTYMLPRVPLCFTFPLWFIAFLYLMPQDVISSVLIGFGLLQVVYPIVAFHLGWMPMFPPTDHPYAHQTLIQQNNGRGAGTWNPLMPWVMFTYGGLPALFIFPLILGWKDFRKSISCIIKPDKEFEATEPLPYRYAYSMILGGVIVLLILWAISGANLIFAFIVAIIGGLYALGSARIRGEAGVIAQIFGHPRLGTGVTHHLGIGLGLWPEVTGATSRVDMGQAYFTNMYLGSVLVGFPGNSTTMSFAALGMESFKIADMSKSNVKDQFLANTIAVAMTTIITLTMTWYLCYTVGIMNGAGYRFWFTSVVSDMTPSSNHYDPDPGTIGFWPQMVAGFFITGAMFLAKLRFVWFPLNPAGFILGNSFTIGQNIQPVHVLIAWLLKIITLRIGGVRLYTKWGIPLAVGLVMGAMINTFTEYVVTILLTVAPWLRVA